MSSCPHRWTSQDWRRKDRMFHGEYEGPTGNQRLIDRRKQAPDIADIVQRERTLGEVEAGLRQVQCVEVGPFVGDDGIRAGRAPGRASFPTGRGREPPGLHAHAPSGRTSRNRSRDRRCLSRRRPAAWRAARAIQVRRATEAAVALEEIRLIVYVLRHVCPAFLPHAWRIRHRPPPAVCQSREIGASGVGNYAFQARSSAGLLFKPGALLYAAMQPSSPGIGEKPGPEYQ
jgi:hypothetical protein